MNPSNSQIAWEHFQTPMILTCANSGWYGVDRNPEDGGWDMVGSYQSYENGFVISGVCAHTNPEGELLWIRLDTNYTSPDIFIDRNQLQTVAHLSSGSIIAGGFVRKAEPVVHDEAWLIKYTIDGCVTSSDCAIVTTETPPKPNNKIEIYPNPFFNILNIHFPNVDEFESPQFIFRNALGQILTEEFLYDEVNEIEFRYSPPGIYFWGIRSKGILLQSGKIVKIDN